MPVKLRVRKGRALTEHHLAQLMGGPDAVLLAGVGYLAGQPAFWDRLSDAQQSEVLSAMEADWRIHGPEIMAAGGDAEPWAAKRFGGKQCL